MITPKHRGTIKWASLINIALKNLFYKQLRTSLTILGVIIGVGAVVFLLAFGYGLRDVVTRQVVDSSSIRTIDVESAKSQLVPLNQNIVKQINGMSDVASVARIFSVAGSISYNNSSTESVLYAVDQGYFNLVNPKVASGSAPRFSNDDSVYVNTSYVKAIGQKTNQDMIGKKILVSFKAPIRTKDGKASTETQEQKVTVKVSGVLDTGSGAEVYVSSSVFTAAGYENASQIKVLADDKKNVPAVQSKIEALGLVTNSPLSTLEQINQVFVFLNLLFLAFGGIGLIIAVLGMFNTLTISLLERTREIGLMIALGARQKDIRRLFMIEAIGLSLIGGILGLIGAFVSSKLADFILNSFAKSRGVSEAFTVFTFSPFLILGVLAFSTFLGLIVVYLPAKRAAGINPIEALRS